MATIPFPDFALVASKPATIDLTTQWNTGTLFDIQSVYVDTRRCSYPTLIRNRSTGQVVVAPPVTAGWYGLQVKTPAVLEVLNFGGGLVDIVCANKAIVTAPWDVCGPSLAQTNVISASGNTTLITPPAGGYVVITGIFINLFSQSLGDAGLKILGIKGGVSGVFYSFCDFDPGVGFVSDFALKPILAIPNTKMVLQKNETLIATLNNALTANRHVETNIFYTIIF